MRVVLCDLGQAVAAIHDSAGGAVLRDEGEQTINSLVSLIRMLELDEVRVMNGLQGEAGLVSDNCVTASDVAGLNCFHACEWVLANKERLK